MTKEYAPGQYRLSHIQLYNWGTFDKFHIVDVARKGFLITGPSGSGKSTLIDAVSAVLVPPGKMKFNAAADSGHTGRDVVTYCRGAWKRQQSELYDEVALSYLRPGPTWTGIALSYADGLGNYLTAYRLMFLSAHTHTSADIINLYALLPGKANLQQFTELAGEKLPVPKARKQFPEALSIHRSYSKFITAFQRTVGIADTGALDLLHRTQSAKSLDDLNAMIRNFMLPEPETFSIAKTAIENFTELKAAHDVVVTAQKQIGQLRPIRDMAAQKADILENKNRSQAQLDGITTYVLGLQHKFHAQELEETQGLLETVEGQIRVAYSALRDLEEEVNSVNVLIHGVEDSGIVAARMRLEQATVDLRRVDEARTKFHQLIDGLHAQMPTSTEEFTNLRLQLEEYIVELEESTAQVEESKQKLDFKLGELLTMKQQQEAELDSIRQFQSAMDYPLLRARQKIAQQVGLSEKSLPFVADLLHIREEEIQWQGAAERVLGGFARQILVPEEHYKAVAQAVNSQHLGVRLVYLRFTPAMENARPQQFVKDSLGTKLEVRPGRFHDWLQAQLSQRFDHRCVDTQEDNAMEHFFSAERAVTIEGQVKESRTRHIKDDRSRIDDRSHWVLSGNTDEKYEALRLQIVQTKKDIEEVERGIRHYREQTNRELKAKAVAQRLLEIDHYELIDSETMRGVVKQSQAELDHMVEGNTSLKDLHKKLAAAEARRDTHKKAWLELEKQGGRLEERCASARVKEEQTRQLLEKTQPLSENVRKQLDQRFAAETRAVHANNVEQLGHRISAALNQTIRSDERRYSTLENNCVTAMATFLQKWPSRSGDLAALPEYESAFLQELERLEVDDLPRFEKRFREMLQDQTRTHLGRLSRVLRDATKKTRASIEAINDSLKEVEFYPGTFLTLKVKEARPVIAKEFLDLLDTAVEGSLEEPTQHNSEDRFAHLSAVIDAMSTSDRTSERQLRQRLDTRLHVKFLGVEVDKEGLEGAVYDSTKGLSGGQAQKLSSFCLAAALRYRLTGMGLTEAQQRKSTVVIDDKVYPRFGTVIVDEAFDKADPEFTRAAMSAFSEFGFHMILVTPDKLLQTVEDYIGGVLIVEAPDRKESHLSSLTLEIDNTQAEVETDAETSADSEKNAGSSAESEKARHDSSAIGQEALSFYEDA